MKIIELEISDYSSYTGNDITKKVMINIDNIVTVNSESYTENVGITLYEQKYITDNNGKNGKYDFVVSSSTPTKICYRTTIICKGYTYIVDKSYDEVMKIILEARVA